MTHPIKILDACTQSTHDEVRVEIVTGPSGLVVVAHMPAWLTRALKKRAYGAPDENMHRIWGRTTLGLLITRATQCLSRADLEGAKRWTAAAHQLVVALAAEVPDKEIGT